MVKLSGKLSFIKESAVARARSLKRVHESRPDRKHDPEPLEPIVHPPVNSTSVKYSPLHLGPLSIYAPSALSIVCFGLAVPIRLTEDEDTWRSR